jgi:hypothetical protein
MLASRNGMPHGRLVDLLAETLTNGLHNLRRPDWFGRVSQNSDHPFRG